MKLEEENKNFIEKNEDLKESIYSLNSKIDKREEDLSELVDKLTEVEKELQDTQFENCQLKNE